MTPEAEVPGSDEGNACKSVPPNVTRDVKVDATPVVSPNTPIIIENGECGPKAEATGHLVAHLNRRITGFGDEERARMVMIPGIRES